MSAGWSEPRPLKHPYTCSVCGRRITPDQESRVHTDGRTCHAGCIDGIPEEQAS